MSTNKPTAEQIQQARELLSFEDKSVRLSPIALVSHLIAERDEYKAHAERAERRVLFLESELAKSGYRYADALTRNSEERRT